MKAVKRILFIFACLGMFLIAGTITCGIRTKYRSLPAMRATVAYSYAELIEDYSFLQYNQASPERGKIALMHNLDVLRKIQNERIPYNQDHLHAQIGLTYLRLYSVELAENNGGESSRYLTEAQKELVIAHYTGDSSSAALAKIIATRDASEDKYFKNVRETPAASAANTTLEPNR
jgi:hypothetical protein